jgi:hypothetical protein
VMEGRHVDEGLMKWCQVQGLQFSKVAQIWVETPPDEPEWEGVLDRLRRAAA